MTFPDVLYSTTATGAEPHISISAVVATVVALILAWCKRGLVLVAIVIYQRWRICDCNVHLEMFITENMELREKMREAGIV